MSIIKYFPSISIKAKISLAIAGLIMLAFFSVETCIIFGLCKPSYFFSLFGYFCIIGFIPPFLIVIYEFVRNNAIKGAKIDTQLAAIDKANLVVTLDIDGKVLSANENFCQLMGYKEQELIGQHHYTLCCPTYSKSAKYTKFWQTLKEGTFVSGEFQRIAKDNTSKWIFGTYTPLLGSNGEYNKVLKIATDVTTQHEAEELVKQKSVYLEHASKIIRHDMHSGINTYLPRGIKSLKRRLNEDIIKELRIQSPLQLIEDGLDHAQKVYSGVYEFTNLVKHNAQMSKTPCDIKYILSDYLRLTAYKNQVLLNDNLPKNLEVNEALFCTALDNLIRNGLKYNDSKTKYVKIYYEDNSICIEDNGRGLSQKEFEHLSQPYTRKEKQKESGTGLGLNICIEILKEHGFTINAQKLQQGTKLTIKL
jgi:two-component system sensor histidine kinase/response regulator